LSPDEEEQTEAAPEAEAEAPAAETLAAEAPVEQPEAAAPGPPAAEAPEQAEAKADDGADDAGSDSDGDDESDSRGSRSHDRGDRDRGGDDDDDRGGGRRRFYGRRKVCTFCVEKAKSIDYKDPGKLRRYVSDRGRIEARRRTGTCAKHQRWLATALKRARHLALLPYSPEHIRISGAFAPRR
jgi:small subunit ribosomal protein S18